MTLTDTTLITGRMVHFTLCLAWVMFCLFGWVVAFHTFCDLIARLRGKR